jgi:AAA+ superfamily predicted ATPase
MPTTDQLSKLFKALGRKDFASAEAVAFEIAAMEEKKGHHGADQLLRGSLHPNGRNGGFLRQPLSSSFDAQAVVSSALSLRSEPTRLSDVMLRSHARAYLMELLKEAEHLDWLEARGIRRRSKVIFFGPPGCGKSFAAQAIANELGVPLYVVRFDSVIGAYLGQTAVHLRELFRFLETARCVLLFDEIDALGKRRGSLSDIGELDRIVIALMQELEFSRSQGLLIATSNMPETLDPALWRRFDCVLRFPTPTKSELKSFAGRTARRFNLKPSPTLLARTSITKNYAEAEKLIEAEARRKVLRDL